MACADACPFGAIVDVEEDNLYETAALIANVQSRLEELRIGLEELEKARSER